MKNIRKVGEFGLIERIRAKTKTAAPVVVGIGDDTAVLRPRPGWDLLVTTDMLIEGRHFRLKEARAEEIGWKAMAVNLSDIAAMGGVPTTAVVAVGLPPTYGVSDAERLHEGLRRAAARFKVSVAGGDTNASDQLVIAVTMLGEVERGRAILRSGAKEGDAVWVTGRLGGSLDSRRHLNFIPRIAEARWLASHFKIRAMMDLSDGLGSDLRRMAKESGVGFCLDAKSIPISLDVVLHRGSAALQAALSDGEDFELLFTLSAAESRRLEKHRSKPIRMTRIGSVVSAGKGITLIRDNQQIPLLEKGYDHFRS